MSTIAGLFKSLLGPRPEGEPGPVALGQDRNSGGEAGFTPEMAAAVCAALHRHSSASRAGDMSPDVMAAICGALHCHFSAGRSAQALFCPPSPTCAWALAGKIKIMEGRSLALDRQR